MDYYIKALRANSITRYSWVLSMFATLEEYDPKEDYDIGILDGNFAYMFEGEMVDTGIKQTLTQPMFKLNAPLTLPAGSLINQPDAVVTTYGTALANQILLGYPFGETIPYINRQFTIREAESIYVKIMVADKDAAPGKVTISQMKICKRGCELIGQLTRVLVHSATPMNIVAPPGIIAFKKKILTEYKEKGMDINDPLVMVDFEKKLLAFDEEFLKNDPSAGVYVSGKVKNISRLKVLLSFGIGKSWSSTTDAKAITRSLTEGTIQTPEDMVGVNNGVRTSSYSRGTEIILGGVTATLVTRIASHLRVDLKDCKTTAFLPVLVRKGEQSKFIGRTIIKGDKTIVLDDTNIDSISGKYIKLRSATTCKNKVVCAICAGAEMAARPDSLGLFAYGVSSKIVKGSLAAFHAVVIKTTEMDMNDIM